MSAHATINVEQILAHDLRHLPTRKRSLHRQRSTHAHPLLDHGVLGNGNSTHLHSGHYPHFDIRNQ